MKRVEVRIVEGSVLRLRDGDLLWIEVDGDLDDEERVSAMDQLKKILPAGVTPVIGVRARPVAPPDCSGGGGSGGGGGSDLTAI